MTARLIRQKSTCRRHAEWHLAQANESAEVDVIVTAVRLKHRLSPRRLRNDIRWANTHYRTRADLGSDARWRERCERLRDVEKLARKLREKLSDETGEWVRHRISGSFPLGEGAPRVRKHRRAAGYRSRDPAPSLYALCHGLARLARVAVREVSREVEIKTGEAESIRPLTSPTAPWPQERNAFHWLIGVELVGIFERHFGRRAAPGRSHNDYTGETGEANSPYIRFAHAVLADLGIKSNRGKPYSRETIARELTRIKTGAPARRKPKYERV